MNNARHEARIRRIAGVLGMDWLPGTWVDKYDGRWWLVGSAGGDQPLPNTGGCATLPEALDAAEAWLAPQIDQRIRAARQGARTQAATAARWRDTDRAMVKIYIAGSSDELDRAEWAMSQARALGYEVTNDWVKSIREVDAANPTDVTREQRQAWSRAAWVGVCDASVFWLLQPRAGHARGAFCELGLATGNNGNFIELIIASGPVVSIFTSLVDHELATDEEALALLEGWVRQ